MLSNTELIWLFLNVFVALSPIGITAFALELSRKPINFGSLIGDGFLFFFTVTSLAGLISDLCKYYMSHEEEAEHFNLVPVIVGSALLIFITLLGFLGALINRHQRAQDDGRGFAIPSLIFAALTIIISVWTRTKVNLW